MSTRLRARWFVTLVAGVGLALAALRPPLALALERSRSSYRVAPGDTPELIAAEFYGDRRYAGVITLANQSNATTSTALTPGALINIPLSAELVTAPGDTLAGLAATHLDDARRAPLLAAWNRLGATATLPAGVVVRIPVIVSMTLAAPETLAQLAERIFGDAAQGSMLKEFNLLSGDELAAGDTVLLPLPQLAVRPDKLLARASDAQNRLDRRASAMAAASPALAAGRAAWRRGDLAEIKRLLAPLDRAFLDRAMAAELGVLLAAAYIALGDVDSGAATFTSVRQRAPGLLLSRYQYPPTVTDAWVHAGGALADPP